MKRRTRYISPVHPPWSHRYNVSTGTMWSRYELVNSDYLVPTLRSLWGLYLYPDNMQLNSTSCPVPSTCGWRGKDFMYLSELQRRVFPSMVYTHRGLNHKIPNERGSIHVILDDNNRMLFIGTLDPQH